MKNPKVTVLMSAYNAEKYLNEAINSILNQTYKNFEFLIINDASKDKTLEIINSYKDNRIVVIRNKKNIGLTKSLNKGLKNAKGEFIARQDADDVSFPHRLQKQVTYLDRNKSIGLLGSAWRLIDNNGKTIQDCSAYDGKNAVHFICHGSVMIRKACILNIGCYREIFKYAQDYDLWLRISEICGIANLKEPLYKLRLHSESVSRVKKAEQELLASLIIQLSEERKKNGKDRFYELDEKKARKIIDQRIKLSGIRKNIALFYLFFTLSKAAFHLGQKKMAFNYFRKAFIQ